MSYAYERKPGWPPDGMPGEWVGWDHLGNLCILRWRDEGIEGRKAGWVGVRFDSQHRDCGGEQCPQAFVRGKDTEGFVIEHRTAHAARGT
jgi:hypothetical protein